MDNEAIGILVEDFLRALFTDGDVEKIKPMLTEDAMSIGYLGGSVVIGDDKVSGVFTNGIGRGLSGLRVDDLCYTITNPVKASARAVVDCKLIDVKDPYRAMKKKIVVFLREENDELRIGSICFDLISQSGFDEFVHLDMVNESLRKELLRSKIRFDAAVQHASLSLWEYDIKEKCIYQKDNSIAMHGFDVKVENVPEYLVETKFVHPDSADEFMAMYAQLFAGAKKVGGIFRVMNAAREKYWWEKITYISEFDDNGVPILAHGFSTDVSEHIEVQKELEKIRMQKQVLARNALFTAVVDLTANKVIGFSAADEKAVAAMTAIKEGSQFGRYFVENLVAPEYREAMEKLLQRRSMIDAYLNGNRTEQMEYRHLTGGGEAVWALLFFEITEDDATGHYIGNFYMENIDRRKKKELQLKSDAELDSLTKVYNRLAFKVLTGNALENNTNNSLAVFGVLDVDNFKTYNDEHGHVYGDMVLMRVADVMRGCFRKNDIIGRLGGDEFVFLLTNIANVDFIKRKLHNLFREFQTTTDEIKKPIGVSIGLAIAPWDGDDFETLYRKADSALYVAKRGGKNRWCIYETN